VNREARPPEQDALDKLTPVSQFHLLPKGAPEQGLERHVEVHQFVVIQVDPA